MTWYKVLLVRAGLIAALALPLGLYGYGVQIIYEHSAKSGPSLSNAVLFVTSLLCTSVSYDVVKHVALLPDNPLVNFGKHMLSVFFALLATAAGCLATAFTHAHADKFPLWVTAITYLVTLSIGVPLTVRSLIKAIEAAGVRPNNSFKPKPLRGSA